jgi:hypothetical protein
VFHRRISLILVAYSSYIATPKRKKRTANDAPQPLSVQKGKPGDMEIDVPAQTDDDGESSLSSDEETERDKDDPDFVPEHGHTRLVEEGPAATSRTYPTLS